MISVEATTNTSAWRASGGSGHFETPPTCVVVDLLAPELQVNGGGGGGKEGRQHDPPQAFVYGVNQRVNVGTSPW